MNKLLLPIELRLGHAVIRIRFIWFNNSFVIIDGSLLIRFDNCWVFVFSIS
jgi:hypothetical protein